MQPERRRDERTATASIAYIHLFPDNGGILLNISDHGLAFRSASPLRKDAVIHFWISLRANERIEGSGELAWTDETRKTGGLCLTALSEAARKQIASWLQEPREEAATRESVPMVAPAPEPAVAAPQDPPQAAKPAPLNVTPPPPSRQLPQTLPPLRESPVAKAPAFAKPTGASLSAPNSGRSRRPRAARHWPLRVVAVMIVFAAIASAIRYRDHLGSFLIYVGSQLAHGTKAKGRANPASTPPAAANQTSHSALAALSPAQQQELAAEIADFDRENQGEETSLGRTQGHPSRAAPAEQDFSGIAERSTIGKPVLSVTSPPPDAKAIFGPAWDAPADTRRSFGSRDIQDGALGQVSEDQASGWSAHSDSQPQNRPQNQAPGGDILLADTAEQTPLYLDVGNSKDANWADQTAATLSRMGLNAIVDHKGHLWMSSYHVLVGPYSTDNNLDKASALLKAHGFSARYAKR